MKMRGDPSMTSQFILSSPPHVQKNVVTKYFISPVLKAMTSFIEPPKRVA